MFVKKISKKTQIVVLTLITVILVNTIRVHYRNNIVLAQEKTVNVSVKVGDTTVTLEGFTTPNAQVTVMEAGIIVGTTQANSLGSFSVTLESQNPGIHEYHIYSTDIKNTPTATSIVSLSAGELVDTKIESIILPSTMYLSKNAVNLGDTVTLEGYAVPNANVRIFISSLIGYLVTTADSNGYWVYNIDSNAIGAGEKEIYSISVKNSFNSIPSNIINLSILKPNDPPIVTTQTSDAEDTETQAVVQQTQQEQKDTTLTETITEIFQELTAEPTRQRIIRQALNYFDVDNSGSIERSEINLSVRRWLLEARGQGQFRCDLNVDLSCNIIDFSILLYYVDR